MLRVMFWSVSYGIVLAGILIACVIGCDEPHAAKAGPMQKIIQPKPVDREVKIDNFTFDPPTLTVSPGTKVTWINHDDVPHTATSSDSPPTFNSKALDTDDKFSFVFTKQGTYAYFCAVHPHMTATIIVK